ncbi:MAG TPA: GGDEF domain-containing protein [Longimicrobiales bacterium]|nr:GGDEF domain-containing protein [Longimicrobiales bacterium]
MPDTIELLSRVPLLQDLGRAEIEKLASRTRREHFRSGADIVQIGAPGRSLYLVMDGLVQVIYPSSAADFELARLGAGDFFGEMALLNDKPRSATVRALTPVDLVALDKEEFRRVVSETPGLALQLLAALSMRIRNADEQISTLSDQAVRDPLTGLLNRRAFQERLHEEVDRARRYGTRFALVMMDVDHFKGINDTLGHVVGDEVLAWVGRILQEHTRAADSPFRIGGEEFAVLCAASDMRMAGLAARRLISVVAEAKPPTAHGVRITLSAGYAGCPDHGMTFEEVYGTADDALLRAKRAGRNQVCDPPDPGGPSSPPDPGAHA